MKKYLIVPDEKNLKKSVEAAEKYGAAFEYDDFYFSRVYTSEEEVERYIAMYQSLGRDTSQDTLHGVFLDICPTSSDPVMRDYSRERMRQSMEISRRLKVRGVVFHSSLISGLKLPSYIDSWLKDMESVFRRLCADFPELDIYLENTTEQEPDLLVAMARKMKDVPNFALCLDYAHAYITKTPLETWVREMGPYVRHIHINDNNGLHDLHQVPGEGVMDYIAFHQLHSEFMPDVPILLELSGAERSEQGLAKLTQTEKEAVCTEKRPGKPVDPTDRDRLLNDMMDTTLKIAREKDRGHLLELILSRSMELANCDAGTLYVMKDNELHFRIMRTISMGVNKGSDGTPIDLKPVPLMEENVCAYSAIHHTSINVPNVYTSTDFDFSGPRRYDAVTGYQTLSMLAIPLMDTDGKVIGVLQLLNAMDANGNVRPFDVKIENLLNVLAAQAAIAMQQDNYIQEIRTLLWSFTSALAEAIDQRTPYNGSHTRKVAEYAGMISDCINRKHDAGQEKEFFDKKRRDQLVMAALLHDIGKMVTPINVMNKKTRLDGEEEKVHARLSYLRSRCKVCLLEGKISHEEYDAQVAAMREADAIVDQVNSAGFLQEDVLNKLNRYLDLVFVDGDETIPYFEEEEKTKLRVRKGTLTEDERAVMEGHVVMSKRILDKVHFSEEFKNAPVYAVQHHEMLNGSGYPNHLKGDEIPLESRILAVADISDALMASDRPYKKAMPKDRAMAILHSMAEEGALDGTLVDYMEESLTDIDPV